jgi:hypothetical protein
MYKAFQYYNFRRCETISSLEARYLPEIELTELQLLNLS